MMFALEEIHKGFSVSILVSVMTSSVTADYICSHIMGLDPVFQFRLEHVLPQNYYWMLLVLGAILGVLGALYNKVMLLAQDLYKKPKFLNETGRLIIAFMAAGVMGILMPSVLGSGGDLIVDLTGGELLLGAAALTFVVKFHLFRGELRIRSSGRNLFPASCAGCSDRRNIRHGVRRTVRTGSCVYQQLCPAGNGRVFYRNRPGGRLRELSFCLRCQVLSARCCPWQWFRLQPISQPHF